MTTAPLAYFDSSVLLKRYVREEGAAAARASMRRFRVLSSAVTPVELSSALARRHVNGDLPEQAFAATLGRLRDDRRRWELLEVSSEVLSRAEELVSGSSLRTLDAIHVASALLYQRGSRRPFPLVTADARQRDAARQLGLAVTWVG